MDGTTGTWPRARRSSHGGIGILLSEPIVEVLRRFDLGTVQLVPVDVYFSDRVRKAALNYYHFVVGTRRRAIDEALSRNLTRPYGLYSSGSTETDDIVVRRSGIDGAVIWMDEELGGKPFFIDPIVRALKAEKLASRFAFQRCRLI
jgi:hypothetical protein